MAEAVGSHVWLHEASLVGLHVGLAHASGSEQWAHEYVRRVIDSTETVERAALVADSELLDAERLHSLGITMLGAVLDRARSVIVSSPSAADIVRSVRPDGPPLLVLPLAFPEVHRPAGPPDSIDIVSMGWLAENKDPLLALEVIAALAQNSDATITFVGPALDGVVEQVRRVAAEMSIADRVSFTGRLDDDAYAARIARSSHRPAAAHHQPR